MMKLRFPFWVYSLVFLYLLLIVLSYFFWDREIAFYIQNLHLPYTKLFKAISQLFKPKNQLIFWPSVCFITRYYLKKHDSISHRALFITFSIAISNAITSCIKLGVGRARPKLLFTQDFYGFKPFAFKDSFYSFPSAHAATIFALLSALAFLFPKFRYPLFIAGFVLISVRIFLFDHYLSDIIGGALIALIVTAIIHETIQVNSLGGSNEV